MLEVARKRLPAATGLEGRFDSVRVVPWGRRELAYAMLVPRAFEADRTLSERTITRTEHLPVGRFVSGQAAIEVALLGVDREVSLLDLVRYLLAARSLTLEAVDATAYEGREAVDALASLERNGRKLLHRFVLVRLGGRFFQLSCTAPPSLYEVHAEAFATALASFRLRDPGGSPLVEPFDYVASSGSLPLGFRCPRSWRSREVADAPYGRQILDAVLIERNDMVGALRVEAFDSDAFAPMGLDQLANEALAGLRSLGFEVGTLRQRFRARLPGGDPHPGERGEVHRGRAFGGEAEARLSLQMAPHMLVNVAVIAPSAEADPWTSMVARRAHEIAALTLNRPNLDFLVPREALRTLHPVSQVTPIYDEQGELDERTFNALGLDESAADEPTPAPAVESPEPEAPALPEEAPQPAVQSLLDLSPDLIEELRAELTDAELAELEELLPGS